MAARVRHSTPRVVCRRLVLILLACSCTEPSEPRDGGQPREAAAAEQPQPEAPPPPPDPWTELLAERPLAPSGLGVGAKLHPFPVRDAEGKTTCRVCAIDRLTIIAIGAADDEPFLEDLKDLDALVYKYGAAKLAAFGLVTPFVDNKAVAPAEPEPLANELDALRKRLRLSRLPLFVPVHGRDAAGDAADLGEHRDEAVWEQYYNVTQGRTVMLVDATGTVQWSGVGGENWAELNRAIRNALGYSDVTPSEQPKPDQPEPEPKPDQRARPTEPEQPEPEPEPEQPEPEPEPE